MTGLRQMATLIVLGLAACGGPQGTGHRDSAAQISSAALFDPARFGDVWHVVAAYGRDAGCGPLAETWAPAGPGRFRVTGTYCGPNGARAFLADAQVSGPGRITREGPQGREELWVLWVDADYRAAVIGTPSGAFARVLSRSTALRPDLLTAAREVLEFNGYDPGRLAGL